MSRTSTGIKDDVEAEGAGAKAEAWGRLNGPLLEEESFASCSAQLDCGKC